MNIEQLHDYCLKNKGVTETFPFDNDTLVLKVLGKMFLLTSLKGWEEGKPSVNLKCDPVEAENLRENYDSILPGYHMSKKHWNTLKLNQGDLQLPLVLKLVDHSYDLVVKGLPKKLRDTL
ncbi:MmcQ/YjbR family DNA-binding protein [Formosa sp. PL04]|uniref:MmcQ/YjbR family DNA-binding protein n=1 Tax=Formosa sp. PL04 TaxID=3081755 RepID=UPI0029811508|nr:MmcQ/YjbR family DNA-binding protein [Formosa sp. PL04]MDW5289229.1 MmcQ/YjbR family DNA-binding protein [Formosa sp. PL04]